MPISLSVSRRFHLSFRVPVQINCYQCKWINELFMPSAIITSVIKLWKKSNHHDFSEPMPLKSLMMAWKHWARGWIKNHSGSALFWHAFNHVESTHQDQHIHSKSIASSRSTSGIQIHRFNVLHLTYWLILVHSLCGISQICYMNTRLATLHTLFTLKTSNIFLIKLPLKFPVFKLWKANHFC